MPAPCDDLSETFLSQDMKFHVVVCSQHPDIIGDAQRLTLADTGAYLCTTFVVPWRNLLPFTYICLAIPRQISPRYIRGKECPPSPLTPLALRFTPLPFPRRTVASLYVTVCYCMMTRCSIMDEGDRMTEKGPDLLVYLV